MLVIFCLEALVMFVAFAFLFYFTTMSSMEDNRSLFVRVYLAMLIVLAIGAYKLSAANNPEVQKINTSKAENRGQPSISKESNGLQVLKEINNV